MKPLRYFIFLLLIVMSSEVLHAQESVFPLGRRWVVLLDYLNPLVNDNVIEYSVNKIDTINGNTYSFIDGQKYRIDGSKIYLFEDYYLQSEILIFDESWEVGDTTTWIHEDVFDIYSMKEVDKYETVVAVGYLNGLKYWDLDLYGWKCRWLQGVGYIKGGREPFEECNWRMGAPSEMFICCVEANGDTLYVNCDNLHLIQTGISSLTSDNLIISPTAGGLSVDLGTATEWSATLYNSNGVTVAQQQGTGSEIFLSTDSKGTHILVVKAGGKVVKKKVLLR